MLAMLTTCTRCGRVYEETSDETANDPGRLCMPCWYLSKVQEAERAVKRLERERDSQAKYMQEQSEEIKKLCRLVDRFIRDVVDGLRPSEKFGKACHEIHAAWRELGYCDHCGQMYCNGECQEED